MSKSVELVESVEFAKMTVVKSASMKFMKPWLKRAGMKFVQPGMKPADMETEKSGMKSAAMEAGVESTAGETAMEAAAVQPTTLEPAANCKVRPQESRSED